MNHGYVNLDFLIENEEIIVVNGWVLKNNGSFIELIQFDMDERILNKFVVCYHNIVRLSMNANIKLKKKNFIKILNYRVSIDVQDNIDIVLHNLPFEQAQKAYEFLITKLARTRC